jgi:hypothetical protein
MLVCTPIVLYPLLKAPADAPKVSTTTEPALIQPH